MFVLQYESDPTRLHSKFAPPPEELLPYLVAYGVLRTGTEARLTRIKRKRANSQLSAAEAASVYEISMLLRIFDPAKVSFEGYQSNTRRPALLSWAEAFEVASFTRTYKVCTYVRKERDNTRCGK
jgi:hypothetical protein